MAQITSRKELEAWLKDKPVDWAQGIAARAALRMFPYSFNDQVLDRFVEEYAMHLLRAVIVSWIARNFPIHEIAIAAHAATRVADYVSYNAFDRRYSTTHEAAGAVGDAVRVAENFIDRAAVDAISKAAAAANRSAYFYGSSRHSFDAPGATVWNNTDYDCEWLTNQDAVNDASRMLMAQLLWPLGLPEGSDEVLTIATTRLLALDPTYQVWINWYNRRIEGHDAAFDIPGDTNRIHDKAILVRLADASDEDFWGKGATYVNTTLQGWIDEAREQAAIDYVASGAPLNLGSEAELAARPELLARFAEVEAELAKLKDQLTSLADSGHGQLGHNQPPDEGSLRDEEIALLNQRVAELEAIVPAIGAALAKLETVVPAAAAVSTQAVEAVAELVVRVPELNLWQRAMQPLEDRTSPEVRKGFENGVGASLLSIPYIAYVALPEAIRAFLHYFYTVWFPVLPG
jgi:hypothetical protein